MGEDKRTLLNPQIDITEINKQKAEVSGSSGNLEDEIKAQEKKLKEYDKRRANLLEAMELGEFEKDEILDRLNKLKLLNGETETKLKQLVDMKVNIASLEDAHIKLDEVYSSVLETIENCLNEVKKLALDALDIRVHASTDDVVINGVLTLALSTIAQTSGCLSSHAYSWAIPFNFEIKVY